MKDYVKEFVNTQQKTHLTALKLMIKRVLPSQQYHQDVLRKSREIKRKFEKSKSNIKGAINRYNAKVHRIGELCMDILKSNWSPAWTLQYLCKGITYILDDPNADSPLNCDAGNLFRSGDLIGYRSMAEMYTLDYALRDFPRCAV